jgi:hypothetical protein
MFFTVLVSYPKVVNMKGGSQESVYTYKTQEGGGQSSLKVVKNQEEDDD